ncbi:hypothetical protein D3C86_1590060 [compost metagenome]
MATPAKSSSIPTNCGGCFQVSLILFWADSFPEATDMPIRLMQRWRSGRRPRRQVQSSMNDAHSTAWIKTPMGAG